MRFRLIDAAKEDFPVQRLCKVLDVSPSGYFSWRHRPASPRQREDLVLLAHIRASFALSRGTYGSPRMTRELQDEGFRIGRRRTARLMRENGLNARQKHRFKRTTDSHHAFPIAPNLIDQDFSAERPNQKGAADISYLWTAEGWLSLAVVLDLFARRVVGWAVSDRLHKELALEALGKALAIRRPGKALIHHSDSRRIEASSRASRSHSDGRSGMLAPQGAPVWFDPHSDRLGVSFPGPVDPSGAPCGEAAPRRCL